MRLILALQYPTKMRYSEWWFTEFPKQFRKYFDEVIVLGENYIEEQLELSNEALLQVTNKLVSYKLVYTPGLAPVFNLLTTTIHRCMYSIMNRRKTQRLGMQKFVDQVQSGSLPQFKQPRRPIRT